MMTYTNEPEEKIIVVVQKTFEDLRAKYAGYSLRRFSRKLDVPSPIVSQVLHHKRKMTRNLALQLLKNIDLAPEEKTALIRELPAKRARRAKSPAKPEESSLQLIPQAELQAIGDWWHFAILRLLETKSVSRKQANEWIAQRLALSETKVANALETLRSLNLVALRRGYWCATGKNLTTSVDVPSPTIRRAHAEGLELAQEALLNVPIALRDYSSVTVTFDPKKILLVKKAISDFRRRLMGLMLGQPKKEVYRLQIQLFPLTKKIKKGV